VWAAACCSGGAGLTLLVVATPNPHPEATPALAAIAAVAAVAGVALLARPLAFGVRALSAICVLATVLITASMAIGGIGDEMADTEMLYLWVVIYAAWFLGPGHAAGHVALASLAYGSLLAAGLDPSLTLVRLSVTATTLAGTAAVVTSLRRHVDGLVERLGDSARRDPLTGLLNRRGFEERVSADLARRRRADGPLSILVGDVDRFKAVNDRLGHAAGDAVLRRMAIVLASEIRPGDILARHGGEEFVVALPGCPADEAHEAAERLRVHVTRAFASSEPPLTISFGVTTTAEPEPLTMLLEEADAALYRAKAAGRDRVMVA
jgi:diguanylate cyclase (GGDEF)-like protein